MLNLTVAITRNPRFEPLIDGTITSKILNLQFVVTTPPELFYRNLKHDEFDVFEMSLSELAISRERSPGTRWQWSALPVFPAKAFLWSGLYVNSQAGIRGIDDLRGKRVGVPDYAMTAALWFRSFLKELYGIKPQDVSWYVGRLKQFSHGAILGIDTDPPAGVLLNWLTDEQTFDRMLDRGDLDAAYSVVPRHDPKLQTFGNNIDRYGGTEIAGNPRLRKLFQDGGRQLVIDYFRRTGIVPANHTVAVQKRLLNEYPWLALELFKLFKEAKQAAYERAQRWSSAYLYFEGNDAASQATLFGDDPFPYGIKANQKMLDLLFRNSHEEGLTHKLARVEDLFHPSTLDT
jgi:4,5-dihydroxyphthalate decarboxylase